MTIVTVDWITEGTSRRPDVPEDVNYERLEDHGGSVSVRILSDNWPPRTTKADLWRRTTDAEAAAIDSLIEQQPVKLRRLWTDAQYLDHTAPEFSTVRQHLVGAFGETRADELLAESK